MKAKKSVLVCILMLFIICSLCGCSKNDELSTKTNSLKDENEETVISVNIESEESEKDKEKVVDNNDLSKSNNETSLSLTALNDSALEEELLNKAKSVDNVTMEMHHELFIHSSGQEFTEEDSNKNGTGNISFEMPDVDIYTNIKVDIASKLIHTTGKEKTAVFFIPTTIDVNSYDDIENGYTYSPIVLNGKEGWQKIPYEENDYIGLYKSTLNDITDISLFENSEHYIMNGSILSSTDSFDFVSLDQMGIEFDDQNIENDKADQNDSQIDERCLVELKFDKKSKDLVDIVYDLSNFMKNYPGIGTVETYKFEYHFSNYDNVTVEIPEEIINNAKENDDEVLFQFDENFIDSDLAKEQGWKIVTESE